MGIKPIISSSINAGGFGFIIFILALIIFDLASKRISVLKNKKSRKWHDVVNKETRETIRRLYLNYLGVHFIAKELDLDVGVVMDIIRGYGIQGREFCQSDNTKTRKKVILFTHARIITIRS